MAFNFKNTNAYYINQKKDHTIKMKFLSLIISLFIVYSVYAQDKMIRYSSLAENSPWGIASGAEWSGDYPGFNPMLKQAGVSWLRYFPEWNSIQPAYKKWDWRQPDPLVVNCRRNGIQLSGVFAYFAKWASADEGTRKCPVKEMRFWRDYVTGVTKRYRYEIGTWEVWNEFNGTFSVNGTPKIYAEMVKEAYKAAKKVDPNLKIGMSCANFDVGFFDAAIKAGAADHFDFLAIHPYENLASVMRDGGEPGFLSMATTLRKMLKDNKQRDDIELWITEIGYKAPIKADEKQDLKQAEALVKAYILAIAQGFKRVCWFEARGPAYGQGTDHGIIRQDWSPRPAYFAMQTMTRLLSKDPIYRGWVQIDQVGYGFVFQGQNTAVMVAWAPPNENIHIKFSAPVKMKTIIGKEKDIKAHDSVALNRVPVFFYDLPKETVKQARKNKNKPFPWGIDYAKTQEVSCILGANNVDRGIKQIKLKTTKVEHGLIESWRKTNFKFGSEGRYVYFRVDSTFASFGTKDLAISVTAKRVDQKKKTSISLLYESLTGYKSAKGRFNVPAGDQWTTHSWQVHDANFVSGWGWNFRTDSNGSAGEIAIKDVRVKRIKE